MKVIAGNRRTGRTTRLLMLASEAELRGEVSYIVCATFRDARSLKEKARLLGIPIREPITLDSFNTLRGVRGNVFVDNAEFLFESFFPDMNLSAVTITTEDETL